MVDLPLVGRGRTAEVFDVGEGRVVKLMLPGFDPGMIETEARKTRAAHDAGVDAPATHGPMTVDGRAGHVFDRVDGVLMIDAVRQRLWRYRRYAGILASVHAALHTGSATGLPDLKDRLAHQIDSADLLGADLRRMAKDRLRSLPDDDRVLHGDFHPGNVVLTPDGPIVIDWLDASVGHPAADVARTSWLLSGPVIEPGTPRRALLAGFLSLFRRHYRSAYRRVGGVDPSLVRAWRLPVLAGRVSEGVAHETGPLIAEIRRLAR